MKSKLYRYRIVEITKYNTETYYSIERKGTGWFNFIFDVWVEYNSMYRYKSLKNSKEQIQEQIQEDNKISSDKIKSKKKIK